MSATKRCPKCQAEIPAAAPEGLCPQCLLQAGLEPAVSPRPSGGEESGVRGQPAPTAAYSPSGSGFVPPTPEALQAAFPQLEILELLGKGGMGAVYKARQPGLDRLVAVKILPPEVSRDPAFAERFTREARALAMLNHPNIVGVYDSGRAFPSPPTPLPEGERGGYYYFVMEYLDGVNLRQAMRAGELKSAEALKIVPQICDALQFAHDEGIVHRDIKPENILLDKKGRVKIADFGLAKLLGKTAADISLTGTQQVMGTMHYMAPEQFEGSRDVDHRADIYSLGVTFYEMLTGELPIGRFAAPSKKVQIDVRLDEVVLRSLEKEPEQRYQQASEIKTEMETITRTPAESIPVETDDSPPDEAPVPRRPRLFQVLGLLAIMGGIFSIFGTTADLLEPAEIPAWLAANESWLAAYHVYSIGSKLVQYLLGVAIVPCGFGLTFRMPWARRATIWITLLEMALLLAVQAPVDFAMEFHALPADGIVRQPDGNQLLVARDQMVKDLTFRYMWQTTGLLISNLLVVYYLTRPHVLKLFGEEQKSATPSQVMSSVRPADARAGEPVVFRPLEKAPPEQRYQHASEIKTEVEGIAKAPDTKAPTDGPKQERYLDPPWVGITLVLFLTYLFFCLIFGLVLGVDWLVKDHPSEKLRLVGTSLMIGGGTLFAIAFLVRYIVWLARHAVGGLVRILMVATCLLAAAAGLVPIVHKNTPFWGLRGVSFDETSGVRIIELDDDSPALRAGLKVSDRVMAVNGKERINNTDLMNALDQLKPGENAGLSIIRPPSTDLYMNLTVTGEEPPIAMIYYYDYWHPVAAGLAIALVLFILATPRLTPGWRGSVLCIVGFGLAVGFAIVLMQRSYDVFPTVQIRRYHVLNWGEKLHFHQTWVGLAASLALTALGVLEIRRSGGRPSTKTPEQSIR